MNQLNSQKVALAVGFFLGGFHLLWSLLIAVGLGQPLVDFIFWAHMIHMQFVVGPFDLTASAVLVILTFLIGYMFGAAFAYIWNQLHRNQG